MFLQSGAAQLVRNTDILGELKKMAESADFAWVQRAAEGLSEVERDCVAICCGRSHSMPSPRAGARFVARTWPAVR